MKLETFLAEARRTPFAWGRFDCSLWLADWLVAQGRPDPAPAWRGAYADPGGAEALLRTAGGLPALVARLATAAGLPRVETPARDDIGLVEVLTRRGVEPAGAICTGPRWAVLSEHGLIVARLNPLAAWRP